MAKSPQHLPHALPSLICCQYCDYHSGQLSVASLDSDFPLGPDVEAASDFCGLSASHFSPPDAAVQVCCVCLPASLGVLCFLWGCQGHTVQGEVLKTSIATVGLGLLQLTADLEVPQANSN